MEGFDTISKTLFETKTTYPSTKTDIEKAYIKEFGEIDKEREKAIKQYQKGELSKSEIFKLRTKGILKKEDLKEKTPSSPGITKFKELSVSGQNKVLNNISDKEEMCRYLSKAKNKVRSEWKYSRVCS